MDDVNAFSPAQRRTLGLVLDRLIPADDGTPGAVIVPGVAGLIAALGTPRYQAHAPAVGAWLDALAPHLGPVPPTPPEIDALLQRIEAGELPGLAPAPFAALVTLTAELFYGSPASPAPERRTPAWDLLGYQPRPQSPPFPAP